MTNDILKLLIFLVATALAVAASWRSLRAPASHGFPRFFAWEAIFIIILLNTDRWFDDSLSPRQIMSYICLTVSAVFVIIAAAVFARRGQPSGDRQDETLMGFEKTTALVTTGIYAWIRHPMYASLIFLTLGAWLKDVTILTTALTAAAVVLLYQTARVDERECLAFFGTRYADYMTRTKMFMPYLW